MSQSRQETVRAMGRGQKTQMEPDKMKFEELEKLENFVVRKENIETRRGIQALGAVDDLLGIGIYEKDTENMLVGAIDTGSNTKLVEISRTNASTTDIITGISGQARPSFASLRGFLYMANGVASIQKFQSPSTTGTISLPDSGIAKYIVSDTERLWAAQTDGVLRFSVADNTGVVSSFTVSGTALTRAGIVQTAIPEFTALAASGRVVLVAGDNRIELHKTPDFSTSGATTYPEGLPTMIAGHDNIGVSRSGAVLSVKGGFFVKPDDGVLYFVSTTGSITEIRDNLGQMESLIFDVCELAYDAGKNLLYIACRDKMAQNDTVIAYNTQDKTFSYFPKLYPQMWAFDENNVYYLDSANNQIQDAFADDYLLDNGEKIPWLARTAITYGGALAYYKKAIDFFLDATVREQTSVSARFYADKKVSFSAQPTPDWQKIKQIYEDSNLFTDMPGGMGFGGLPGLGFNDEENITEVYDQSDKINKTFIRAALEVAGEASNTFTLRGLGMTYVLTNRKAQTLTMN